MFYSDISVNAHLRWNLPQLLVTSWLVLMEIEIEIQSWRQFQCKTARVHYLWTENPYFIETEGSSDTRDGNNDDINTVCSGPVSIFAAHIKPRHSYDNSRIKPPSCHICRRGERSLVWRMWRTMLTIVVNTFTWSRWSPDKVCVQIPSCVNNIDSF